VPYAVFRLEKILSTSRVAGELSHTGNYATTAITVFFRGEVGTIVGR